MTAPRADSMASDVRVGISNRSAIIESRPKYCSQRDQPERLEHDTEETDREEAPSSRSELIRERQKRDLLSSRIRPIGEPLQRSFQRLRPVRPVLRQEQCLGIEARQARLVRDESHPQSARSILPIGRGWDNDIDYRRRPCSVVPWGYREPS